MNHEGANTILNSEFPSCGALNDIRVYNSNVNEYGLKQLQRGESHRAQTLDSGPM